MDRLIFRHLKKRLERTQKQMANLLGVSLKAVHSYEQGWRVVPPAVERQLFFLVSHLKPAQTLLAGYQLPARAQGRLPGK